MAYPKFSFVVTTKNRAHLVADVIESLLRQTESNFEIVIVNNDDTEQTTEVINNYSDPRIRHIRTGGLGMPQNWRRGLDEAHGEWVIFVEEKYRIKRNSLEILSYYIERNQCEVLTWLSVLDWKDSKGPDFYVTYSKAEEYDSHQYLLHVANGASHLYFNVIPKLLNCAIKRSLINTINGINSKALCSPISCDLTSAFSILAHTKSFLYLNCSLSMIPQNSPSNGENFHNRSEGFQKFIIEAGLKEEDAFKYVSAKYLSLQNSIYNDFASIMQMFSKSQEYPIDLPSYYSKIAVEAYDYLRNGTPFNDERALLQKAFKAESLTVRFKTLTKDLECSFADFHALSSSAWKQIGDCIQRNLLLWGFLNSRNRGL